MIRLMSKASPVPIAFCITELEIGGAERALVELVTRLDRRRFLPSVYALGPRPSGEDRQLTDRLEDAEVEVQFLNASGLWHVPRVLRELKYALRTQQPALLQTFLWHANLLGAIAGRRAGIPHIVTGIRVAERRRNLHGWFARKTAHLVDRHVCVSHGVAEFSAQKFGLARDRLVVISNGIDIARYPVEPVPHAALGLADSRRAVTFVGRLDGQKRVDWLLKRFAQIAPALPEHDLLIAGRGPERERLEQLAQQLQIANRVRFLGWRADVPGLLSASDLLVLTSASEGMPNVVLEAMASGIPLVATQAEGVTEVLGDLADQQSVAIDDADGFCEKVVTLAQNRQLASDLGRQNRIRVKSEFSLEKMVVRYEQLYESLLRSHD